MSRCPKYYEVKFSKDGLAVKVRPRYCQKWTCPRCGQKKAHETAISLATTAAALTEVSASHRVRFLSCTFAQKHVDRETAWAQIGPAVQAFCRRLKYQKSSEVLAYAWVIGKHRNGYPHAHVMTVGGRFLPVSHLRAIWARCSDFGGSVRPSAVRTEMAAWRYFAGNAASKLDEQVGRRIGCSQNISLRPARSESPKGAREWTRVSGGPGSIARELAEAGYIIAWKNKDNAVNALRVLATPAPPVLLGIPVAGQANGIPGQAPVP